MTRSHISHALGLHMHQPPGNLRLLIQSNPWEAEQIIRCYERPLRYAAQYPDLARLHIGFSGALLEQLLDPWIVEHYRYILDIPDMLRRYRETENIELIGMGYYHPIFPLIPRADWKEQLERGREIVERALGRRPLGFWPPEMAFTMEMVPALVDAGYEYVVVDGVHVRPEDGINDGFRPYLACYQGVCITVVPRDRTVSNAQESGLDPIWFQAEVQRRVGGSPRPDEPRLVTTWSDGENGGWFRQTHEPSGFFGHYFTPYMERVRGGDCAIRPVALGHHLRQLGPSARAQVQTGAWNIGGNPGLDLSQWAGSEGQGAAVSEVGRLSARYWALRRRVDRLEADVRASLEVGLGRAHQLILESETSCFLFWGDAWIPHLYERTVPADQELQRVAATLDAMGISGAAVTKGEGPPADSPRASTRVSMASHQVPGAAHARGAKPRRRGAGPARVCAAPRRARPAPRAGAPRGSEGTGRSKGGQGPAPGVRRGGRRGLGPRGKRGPRR